MTGTLDLPLLTHEVGKVVRCSATVRAVGDRIMLALPFRAGFGPSRGRRYRITVDGARTSSQVVMVVGSQAMVPFPDGSGHVGDAVEVELRVLAQRPTLHVPKDFVAALKAEGLTLDVIAAHELNQLVTMIQEASDSVVRASRIDNAVAAVARLSAVRVQDADAR